MGESERQGGSDNGRQRREGETIREGEHSQGDVESAIRGSGKQKTQRRADGMLGGDSKEAGGLKIGKDEGWWIVWRR